MTLSETDELIARELAELQRRPPPTLALDEQLAREFQAAQEPLPPLTVEEQDVALALKLMQQEEQEQEQQLALAMTERHHSNTPSSRLPRSLAMRRARSEGSTKGCTFCDTATPTVASRGAPPPAG